MKSNIKTALIFVLIAVVAYASRLLSDAVKNNFIGDNKKADELSAVEEPKVKIPESGSINGHDYVDLGLSVKWATCNVGASNYTDYGDYFAWGETEPKENYSWKTYMWCNGSSETINKYGKSLDYMFVLESLDDAATVNWGAKWRMPTIAELQELANNCTWEWKIINGVNGYKITAKNNNWIFLPAAGRRYSTSISNEVFGYYWSSIVDGSNNYYAYGLSFSSSSKGAYSYYRHFGHFVRPVTDIR